LCSCCYTNFSGIICWHIFKVATQLNLDEIPQHLFFTRWRKDPSDNILVKKYKSFYNDIRVNQENENANNIMEDEDYEYLLNRVWYKVQQLVKTKPKVARNFYILLDKSLNEEISFCTLEKKSKTQKIKNPGTIKQKGNFFFKYYYVLFNFNLLIN